jgi:hypothetical protein
LNAQCAARAPLFEPQREQRTLIRIASQLLGQK